VFSNRVKYDIIKFRGLDNRSDLGKAGGDPKGDESREHETCQFIGDAVQNPYKRHSEKAFERAWVFLEALFLFLISSFKK
jgi:hypothetical protein